MGAGARQQGRRRRRPADPRRCRALWDFPVARRVGRGPEGRQLPSAGGAPGVHIEARCASSQKARPRGRQQRPHRRAGHRSCALSPPTAVRCVSRRRSPFLVWAGLRGTYAVAPTEPADLQQLGTRPRWGAPAQKPPEKNSSHSARSSGSSRLPSISRVTSIDPGVAPCLEAGCGGVVGPGPRPLSMGCSKGSQASRAT